MYKEIFARYRKIIENTGYLSVIEIIKLSLPFIALPYLIRTVGVENYGIVAFAQTIISYFVIFINWGLDYSAVKDVSVNRNDKKKLSNTVSSVLLIKSALLLLSFLILCIAISFVDYLQKYLCLYLFSFLTCFSEVLFPIWFFVGIEKMKYLTIIRLSSVLFYTACIFIFIHRSEDYTLIALFQSLGNVIAGIIAIYLLIKVEKVVLVLPSYKEIRKTFLLSIPFFTSRISSVAKGALSKTICGVFLSMQAVAAFDLVLKLCTAAVIPSQTLNQAIYPHNAKNQDTRFAQKMLHVNVLMALSIATISFLLAPLIIRIFSGNELPEAVNLLRIMSLYILCGNLTMYIGTPVLVAFGHPAPFNHSVVYSTILLCILFLILYLCNIFTINTIAVTLGLSELFVLAYRLYFCFHFKIFNLRTILSHK